MSGEANPDAPVSPVLALRAAVHAALSDDEDLVNLLGGDRIYDQAPRGVRGPYVTLGQAQARDLSAGDRDMESQQLLLSVYAPPDDPRLALEVAGQIRAIVASGAVAPEGRRLVLLRVLREDLVRDARAGAARVRMTLAAITEAPDD